MAGRTNILLIATLAVFAAGCSDADSAASTWKFEDPAAGESEVEPPARWVEADTEVDQVCSADDLEVVVVPVNGTVQTQGPWVDETGWSVVFTDDRTNARYVFSVEGGSYVGELPAGSYELGLQTSALPQCTYSCVVSQRSVEVGAERAFDFDVELVQVDGDFWLDRDGSGFPAEPSAHLEFRSLEMGTTYSATVSRGVAGGFGVLVPAGEYEVHWVADEPSEFGQYGPLGVGFVGAYDFRSSEYVSLELNSMTVTGEVLVDGATMPDDTLLDGAPRGALRFSLRGPRYGVWEVPLSEIGPGVFSQRVFPGDYAIEFITYDATQQAVFVPNRIVSVCAGEVCELDATTGPLVVDVDGWIEADLVQVSGQVDMDEVVGTDCAAGRVQFKPHVDVDAAYSNTWGTEVDARGRFELELPAGAYAVSLNRGAWHCDGPGLGLTILDTNAVIAEPRSDLSYAARSGEIAGELTINGGTMPDNGLSDVTRGVLELRQDGGVVSIPLGATGPAVLEQRLLPGSYEAVLVTEIVARCAVPFLQDALPRGARNLGTVTVHPEEQTVLDIDLDVVELRDTVQFSGLRDLEGTLDGRGLSVELVDTATGFGYQFAMDLSGEFTGLAYPGTYEALLSLRQGVGRTVYGPPLGESLVSECYTVAR